MADGIAIYRLECKADVIAFVADGIAIYRLECKADVIGNVKTSKGLQNIKKAEKQLLNEQIRSINNIL